ncbi:MAG: hypothetical protein EXR72_16385 [Myxococcales bacterium]|nr:hypothetical protein [Myxococcales bacterium]
MKPFLAVLLLLLGSVPALAQVPGGAPAAAANGEWKDADLAAMGEGGYQSTTLVTAAYSFIWVMVLVFVASVWLRSRRLHQDLAELEARIARGQTEG